MGENTEIDQNAAAENVEHLSGNKNGNGYSNANGVEDDENKKTEENIEQKKQTFVDELRNEPMPECDSETKGGDDHVGDNDECINEETEDEDDLILKLPSASPAPTMNENENVNKD